MNQELWEKIREAAPQSYRSQMEPMGLHTTFKTGGMAEIYVEPQTEEELLRILELCRREGVQHFLLGNGSDLLVSDKGYSGVMISTKRINYIELISDGVIEAGAGAMNKDVAKFALLQSLSGFEFASGIPGSLGGAVFMNAGAYGGECKDVLLEAKIIEEDGTVHWAGVHDLDLGYRHSNIGKYHRTVVAVRIRLFPGDEQEIRKKMEELEEKRISKQPLEFPSAGSTFKRPEGYFAGKLIHDAKLAGLRIGGAEVSRKHCGFIINTGDATASDIYQLIVEVQKRVKEQFDVDLIPEVHLIGDFS